MDETLWAMTYEFLDMMAQLSYVPRAGGSFISPGYPRVPYTGMSDLQNLADEALGNTES